MGYATLQGILIRRLRPNADLLEELEALVRREAIELGILSGIGALSRAALGIFLPGESRYEVREFAGELEICHLAGNISVKEEKPFVHAHLIISDRDGRAYGGHLLPGCRIFVAEVLVTCLRGARMERFPHPELAGLSLWPLEEES